MVDNQFLLSLLSDPSTKWIAVAFVFVLLLSSMVLLMAKTLPILKQIKSSWVKSNKDLLTYFKLRTEIDQACRDIKHDLHADRVSVYEYKNGEISLGKVPFMSVKITSESKSFYAKSILVEQDQWPSAVFGALNLKMMQGQVFICWDTEKNNNFIIDNYSVAALQDFMKMYGTKSFMMFPMLKPNGRCLGFGLVEFTNELAKTNEALISQTTSKFGSIGGLLAVLSEMGTKNNVK